MPPLNDRKDDIPLLADHFMNIICQEQGIPAKSIADGGYDALKEVNWTGNIRELRNVVERLIILCGSTITREDVKTHANPGSNFE